MPAPRFHPFARLLIATLGTLAWTIAIVIVIAAATAVAAGIGGQDAERQIASFFSENLLLANLFIYPPVLLWLWICRRFFDRRAFVSLGLRARGFFAQFFGGTFCGFLAVAFVFGVLWLCGAAQVKGWSVVAQTGGMERVLLALIGWALMMLCVGFMEEVAFRGYAFHNLNIWLGGRAANIVQAVVFALIHLGNLAASGKSTPDATLAAWLAMPNIALIGVFFALCYLKTGSLWFPIAFHAAWNFFLGCVFSLPVSGLPIFQLLEVEVRGSVPLTGGAFGPEASLLLTPILLALIFVVARVPDSTQAVFDLESLQTRDEVVEEPTTDYQQPTTNNRFKTRMGGRQNELDEETRRTLRMLNETPHETSTVNTAASTPVAPPVVEASVPTAEAIVVAAESTPSASPVEFTPIVEDAPIVEVEAEPEKETIPEVSAAPPSTPPGPPPKPKSVPRW